MGEDAAAAIETIYQSGLALSPESIEVLESASRRADFQELSRAQQEVVQGLVDLVRHGGEFDTQENRDALYASAIELTKRIQASVAYSVDGYRAAQAAAAQDAGDVDIVDGWARGKVEHGTAHVHLTADDSWIETRKEISRIADQIAVIVDAVRAGNKVVQVDEVKRADGRLDPTEDRSFAKRAQQVNL